MKPPWILLHLSFLANVLANEDIIPKHKVPKDMCKVVMTRFSQTVANYTECLAGFARPIEVCLRCRNKYLEVKRSYEYMEDFKQDNVSCKVVLTKQDRLGIVENMYHYVTGSESLWVEGSCSNCYFQNDPAGLKANHTKNFEELWDKTVLCFRQFINLQLTEPEGILYTMLKDHDHNPINGFNGSLCSNCSKIYNSMRSYFWDHVVPSSDSNTMGGVCYDIRDRFNVTGIIWKENFDCEPKPKELPMLLPIILVTILCIVLTYTCEPFIIPRLFPSVGQTIGVVQQDIYDGETIDNTEEEEMIQGNFEVIPGVTANEYIERFREYDIQTADGNSRKIRVPPPPQEFYDLEFDNDEWVVPPKEVILKMSEAHKRFKNGEISQKQMDILHMKYITDALKQKKKRNASGATIASVILDDGLPMTESPQRTPERSLSEEVFETEEAQR